MKIMTVWHFHLPSSISDVITVANKNLTMPPKSTWFDPKPLDGLVVYEFKKMYE